MVKRLIHRHRWMLLDDDTQEVKISFKINLLNSLLIFAFATLFIGGLSFLLMKYSPLKNYFVKDSVPVDLVKSQKDLLSLNEKLASLEDSLAYQQLYLEHMRRVVKGDFKAANLDSLMAKQTPIVVDNNLLKASAEDSVFRVQIAKEELEALKNTQTKSDNGLLYAPVNGVITSKYDIKENHLATDIAASKGESIKAVESGEVLFTDWNPQTGNSLIIRHKNDIISMYKHCSKVFVKVGQEVEKGDVIAEVGNTGELTTGPHLHFELWVQGKAVDPEQYIDF